MAPDFIARVTLLETKEGGRKGPTPGDYFGCPISFEKSGHFDCRFLLVDAGPLVPGETKEIPVKMLYLEDVKPFIKKGVQFKLWEGKPIGNGEILEVTGMGAVLAD